MTKNVSLLKGKVVVQDKFSSAEEEILNKKYKGKTVFEFWRTSHQSLCFLESMENIESLSLINTKIDDATALADLNTLNHLFLNGIKLKSGWDFLADLKQIRELHILNIKGELTLPNLAKLDSLNTFRIWGCKGLGDVSFLLGVPKLEEIELIDTALQPDDLLGLLAKPSVRYVNARFNTKKNNDLFLEYLQKFNKKQYRDA